MTESVKAGEVVLTQGKQKWIALILLLGMMSVSISARAQDETDAGDADETTATTAGNEVTAKGVGVVGGILAGAEVVLVTESIIRVKPLWPYIVIPIAGAVGGGIGGYKLEQKTKGGAIALLITGMVGIIPSLIATASARSFHPEDVGARNASESLKSVDYMNVSSPSEDASPSEAVVEVEARPTGIPEAPMGPPPPSAVSPSNDGATGAEGGDAEYQLEVEPDAATDDETSDVEGTGPDAGFHTEREERLAHLSSGALFHMNRQLRFGFGVPAIDVVPVQVPSPYAERTGVAIRVPLIALDLP